MQQPPQPPRLPQVPPPLAGPPGPPPRTAATPGPAPAAGPVREVAAIPPPSRASAPPHRRPRRATDPTLAVIAGLAVVALVVAGLVLLSPSDRGSREGQTGDSSTASPAGKLPAGTAVAEVDPSVEAASVSVGESSTFGGPVASPAAEGPAAPAGAEFNALVERLTFAAHQPRSSLDAANPMPHEADLCDVGDVAISLAFPTETLPGLPATSIVCQPDGPKAWRLDMRSSIGTRREVGGLAVREGRLVATLPRASSDNQAGRAAVAAAVIGITAAHDPQRRVHVQLRRSAVQPPLVFPQLAFDPRLAAAISRPGNDDGPTVPALSLAARPTPWPCRAHLVGRCGNAEAALTAAAEGTPFAGPGAVPMVVTAAWTSPAAPQEPFLRTSFTIEPVGDDSRKARFRLTAAELPPAWCSLRRFGSLVPDGPEAAALPGGVPPAGLLPPVARLMTDAGWLIAADAPVSSEQMVAFARAVAKQHREESPAVVTAPLVFRAPRFVRRREPVATWLLELREELAEARGDAAITLQILIDELAAAAAGKRLAADVIAGLGSGTAVFAGRIETFFPSLEAAAVIVTVGADDTAAPRP